MYPALHFWQWQRLSFRKVAYIVLGIYLLITCYTTFRLLNRKIQAEMKDKKLLERIQSLAEIADDPDWNPWGEEFESEQQPERHHVAPALWKKDVQPLEVEPIPVPLGKRSPLGGKEGVQPLDIEPIPVPLGKRSPLGGKEGVQPLDVEPIPVPLGKRSPLGGKEGVQPLDVEPIPVPLGKRSPLGGKEGVQPLDVEPIPVPLGKRSPLGGKEGNSSDTKLVVEIWSKAAIGLYMWEHIMEGLLEPRLGGVWSFGERSIGAVTFRFRTGPGVVPSKVPQDTENLLLVLNGREPSKVEVSKMWLEYLPSLPRLRNAAVLLLGNERCDNSWIHPYMSLHGGVIRFIFLVYDSPEVDNISFFQWPLGVATYRGFPLLDPARLPLNHKRPYIFNFLGTVYKNSSRESLLLAVNGSMYRQQAYLKPRLEWLPQETAETAEEYLHVLSRSDLTLSPVGINTECYRIYESLAMGSVPVIEDVMTPGFCGDSPGVSKRELFFDKTNHILQLTVQPKEYKVASRQYSAPLRLLKEFEAPVIFIKEWRTDLEAVLKKESQMSDLDIVRRREHVIGWYEKFKAAMRERLVFVLLDKFFHIKTR